MASSALDLDLLDCSVRGFFLDSGAHSLYSNHVIKRKHEKRKDKWDYYRSADFDAYVESYIDFINTHRADIDYYATIDVIFNPSLSWKILKRLEKAGLNPVPVIHYGTDMKWVRRYLDAGYTFLGIGGLGQEVTANQYYSWADQLFSVLCPKSNDRLPLVRTHGFAMTSWALLRRYPWWSVDSASWIKSAAYGGIYVPRKKNGVHSFEVQPISVCMSGQSSSYARNPTSIELKAGYQKAQVGQHWSQLSKNQQALVTDWLEMHNIPLGSVDENGGMIEMGVISHHKPRALANLVYFEAMKDSLPEWPWAFTPAVSRKGFFK